MDKKKKILLIGSVVVIIAAVVFVTLMLFNKPEEEEFKIDGINLPQNKEALKEKEIDGLKITNVSLLTREGISTYKALVTNSTDNEMVKTLDIIFYIDDEEIKITKNISLGSAMNMYVNIEFELDLTNVSKIDYVLK